MDLRTFVAETLTQIVQGLEDAQTAFRDRRLEAKINPTMVERGSATYWAAATPVEFDVALTVGTQEADTSSEKIAGKAGILSVASASGETGGSRTSQAREERVSRIKFNVMLAQPADTEDYEPGTQGGLHPPFSEA